jgi:predicted enzyme related to lactoylglutathione lyase
MSKLFGPDFIALQVRDLEISKLFYMEHLQLSLADQSPPGAVVFKTSPIPFAIRTAAIDLSAAPQLGWGVAIWLACKDADFFYESLQKAAVSILTPIHDGPFGRFFTFKDPDGYSITLHTKPTHATR